MLFRERKWKLDWFASGLLTAVRSKLSFPAPTTRDAFASSVEHKSKVNAILQFSRWLHARARTKWNYMQSAPSPRQTNTILMMSHDWRTSHNYLHKDPMWSQPENQTKADAILLLSRCQCRHRFTAWRGYDADAFRKRSRRNVVHELISIVVCAVFHSSLKLAIQLRKIA